MIFYFSSWFSLGDQRSSRIYVTAFFVGNKWVAYQLVEAAKQQMEWVIKQIESQNQLVDIDFHPIIHFKLLMGGAPSPIGGKKLPIGGKKLPIGGIKLPMGGSPSPMGTVKLPMEGWSMPRDYCLLGFLIYSINTI